MRNLKVAYGNSRNAKKWSNKTICYDDLKNRLRTPIRTTETMEVDIIIIVQGTDALICIAYLIKAR